MDLKEVKQVIRMVEEANITSLTLESETFKVEIKKEFYGAAPVQHIQTVIPQVHTPAAPAVPVAPAAPAVTAPPAPAGRDAGLVAVKSPMVGTFYASPNPDSPVYVKVGDTIQKGQVVCIIEAMKLFNEIESDVSGTVVEIMLNNSSPVEYGQELFFVRPH